MMTPDLLIALVHNFFAVVGRGETEIYNEVSLQHEFGAYLRLQSGGDKAQFERPAHFFGVTRPLLKKEIDLVLFSDPVHPIAAIEFKFPRAGQVPIQMFKACQDIGFLEDLAIKERKFAFGLTVFAADDDNFYQVKQKGLVSIYDYFRSGVPMRGTIAKTTGTKEPDVILTRDYQIRWNRTPGNSTLRYYVVPVMPQCSKRFCRLK